jgi:hypothetical protein
MEELYKTLEFKGIERKTLGKYAHIIEIEKNVYEWGGSLMPSLMTNNTTIEDLRQLYKKLNFDIVDLVDKKLID